MQVCVHASCTPISGPRAHTSTRRRRPPPPGVRSAERDTSERAAAEVAAASKRMEEMEAELSALRASGKVISLFQLPTKQDVLAGEAMLGAWPNGGHVRPGVCVCGCVCGWVVQLAMGTTNQSVPHHQSFTTTNVIIPATSSPPAGLGLEVWKDDRLRWKAEDVEQQQAPAATSGPLASRSRAAAAAAGGGSAKKVAAGQVSLRTWLLVAYLSVLHVAVMVSFTRNTPDVNATLCADQLRAIEAHALHAHAHELPKRLFML